jgi:hypothetical protein
MVFALKEGRGSYTDFGTEVAGKVYFEKELLVTGRNLSLMPSFWILRLSSPGIQ